MQPRNTVLIVIALVWLCAATNTNANSALSVDTALGNALNPTGRPREGSVDPRGIATFKPSPSRGPSGLLYSIPPVPAELDSLGTFSYRGTIEFALLGHDGDDGSARFMEYSDWDSGFLLNSFDLGLLKEETGYYLDLSGGGANRDDQYYRVNMGRYGTFKLTGFFDETPHVFATNAVSFFDGIGSGQLRLPQELTPGANSVTAIETALGSAPTHTLSLSREKGGIMFELTPKGPFTLFGKYSREKRDGTRPFGGGFFPSFYGGDVIGGMVQTIEPIDYVTHELLAGLQFVASRYQFNLTYTGSLFRNEEEQLTWENPFMNFTTNAFLVERGRFALAPDNDYHHVKGDFAFALPLRGRLSGNVSWARAEQDDDLLPPTVNSGVTLSGIDLTLWNTADALSRRSADVRIDTLNYQLGLRLVPWSRLTLSAKFKYRDEDNDTRYTALNPLTGEFGYIIEDGAHERGGVGVFRPGISTNPFHFRSIPFAHSRALFDVDANYRINRKTTLNWVMNARRSNATTASETKHMKTA